LTSDDLPLPDTPVTQVMTPSGKRTSMFFRLFARAPRTSMYPLGFRRTAGTGTLRLPDRYAPVIERSAAMISAGVPHATTSPPSTPAPGPMSTM